jgi:uncharacterized protein YcfJ
MKLQAFLFATAILGTLAFADEFSTSESVKVSRSEPVYKNVVYDRPIKECWDESVERRGNGDRGGNDVVGGIVGGAIGGALGNQVGQGSGKTAATIGGAILGSMVGQGLPRGDRGGRETEIVQRCKTRYESENKRVLAGYNNYGIYKGREIVKFSDSPLQYITVYTNVSY